MAGRVCELTRTEDKNNMPLTFTSDDPHPEEGAATISRLIGLLITRKLIASYFNNRLIVSVICQAKVSNIAP